MEKKKVTIYIAKDGSEHKTKKACTEHENIIDFEKWYEDGADNILWGSSGQSSVDAGGFIHNLNYKGRCHG